MKKIIFSVILLALLTGCGTISYSPKITLDVSPKTISKTVQIDKFEDLTNYKNTGKPFLGYSLISENTLAGNLDLEITNVILSDFSSNSVFSDVKRRIENPDYIMKGKIIKFRSVTKPNTFGYISPILGIVLSAYGNQRYEMTGNSANLLWNIPLLLPFVGVPIQENIVEILIELEFYDKSNQLVSKISSGKRYQESFSIYNNNILALQSNTNQTLTSVVKELREKILEELK
jgi:hypothetical protein